MGDNLQILQHEQTGGHHDHHSEYYHDFDEMTNGGRAFNEDFSAVKVDRFNLSEDEVKARKKYEAIVIQLNEAYKNPITDHPVAVSQEQVLQQRVVATCLTFASDVSSRSAANEPRAGRIYPEQIHPWIDFEEQVKDFTGDTTPNLNPTLDEIFKTSLIVARVPCSNEAEEQKYLTDVLYQTLRNAGIVHSINVISKAKINGKPDFYVLRHDETVSIICECKSTHNLLLPMTADDCTRSYNRAYSHGANTNARSIEWSNVAHAIGQLLCYMVDNKHRYGVLTSGTRTYFVKIQGQDKAATSNSSNMNSESQLPGRDENQYINLGQTKMKTSNVAGRNNSCNEITSATGSSGIKVYISDAWCLGQANYLRAWAYMHTLHGSNGTPWRDPVDWIKSTTNHVTKWKTKTPQSPGNDTEGQSTFPNVVRDRSGKMARSCHMEYFFPLHQGALELAPLDEIEIVGVLGYGRNGACFKVKWNGTEYAMKQFDIGRHGDMYFRKEIRAYMILQKAWGILVPQPIFLSESFSGGTMFLGLQLGCESKKDDDSQKFEKVLQQIETEYGIRHNDIDRGRNMITITDSNGVARVVAIDFEDWDDVSFDCYHG